MRINRRWFDASILWRAPLGFLWTWLLVRTAKAVLLFTPDDVVGYVELPLLVAVGAGYALLTVSGYLAIAQNLLNRTVVTATGAELRVTHGLIPGEAWHRLRRQDVLQLVCVQVPGWFGPRWDLIAIVRGGHRVALIRNRPLEELLEIERAVERAMGITDIPRPPSALVARPALLAKSLWEPLFATRFARHVTDDRLVLSWRWFNPSAAVILAMLGATVVFANLPEAVQTLRDVFAPRGVMTPSLARPLWQLTFGLALGYVLLAFLFNRTVVSAVRGGTLAIRRGPVPLLPPLTLATYEVRQLYEQRPPLGRFSAARLVRAVLLGGRRVTLLRAPDAKAAADIERELERWLRIRDEPAPESDAAAADADAGEAKAVIWSVPSGVKCRFCARELETEAVECPGCHAEKGYLRDKNAVHGLWSTLAFGILFPGVLATVTLMVGGRHDLFQGIAAIFAIPVVLSVWGLAQGPRWFRKDEGRWSSRR